VERLGVKARIVEGSYDNIKITTPEDVELGALILERWQSRNTDDL
jgi:2-C-methyl-D-erythritol 4-phosphate cytidylyltransferase